MIKKGYKKEHKFPNESFVQSAIERHFTKLGFNLERNRNIDLYCTHPVSNEAWIIEAKGLTTAIGLDFKTCLGQLIMSMNSTEINYGVAVPNIANYLKLCQSVPKNVTDKLNISWIYISESGQVEIHKP